MNKYVISFTVFVLLFIPQKANAHVLLRDTAANIGAIVHINPDDDPVAGEETQMYIDLQDSEASTRIPREAYNMFVTTPSGVREEVETSILGSVVQAKYTFKAKGLYTLEIASDPAYDTFQQVTMTYPLRVSRGAGSVELPKEYAWSEILLPMSGVGVVLAVIIGWNNKREILAKSKF